MKTLHVAGTILGIVGSCVVLTAACGGSSSDRTTATGGNGGNSNGGTGNVVGGGSNTGGTAGIIQPPSDCVSVAAVPSDNPLIADFECMPGPDNQKFDWFPWPDYTAWAHGAYWYYDSAAQWDPGYQTPDKWTCTPTARGGLTTTAAEVHSGTTAGYVEALVPASSWGAGFGIWMGGSATTPDTDTGVSCIDASAYTGITFWVRGQNTGSDPVGSYQMRFDTFDTKNAYPATPRTCTIDSTGATPTAVCTGDKAGGCTAAACKPYTYAGTVTDTWTQVTVLWSDLTAPVGGVTAAFNPAKLTGIDIGLDASLSGGTIQFYIDDVEFVGSGTSQIGRECPPPAAGGATGAGGAPDYTTWQTAGAGGTNAALPDCDGTPAAGAGP